MLTKMMTVFVAAAALTARLPPMHLHSRAAFRTWFTHPATRDQRAVGAEPVRGRHVGAPILTEFPDLSVPRSLSAEKNLVPHYADDGGSK